MILSGNHSATVPATRVEGVIPGFDTCTWYGSAAISAVPATSWQIFNGRDEEATIFASATDPVWIAATFFDLKEAFQGTPGSRLKLGTTPGDTATYISRSAAVDSGGFLQQEDNIRSQAQPFQLVQITAPVTFRLYLENGGTGLIPAPPSPTVTGNPAPIPLKSIRVPVRIDFLRRSTAPEAVDVSALQSRFDLGLPA
jgi:hypothetical protein